MRLSIFFRLIRIYWIILKYRLDQILLEIRLFTPLRFLVYGNPWYWWSRDKHSRGERLRKALIELGPIFVKFGQTLSTRRDLLPDDIVNELALLQDKVPPFPSEQVKQHLEAVYEQPIEEVFAEFDPQALASASIAQVHAATLFTGKQVVVKILRPGIKRAITCDIALLYKLAALIERYSAAGKRLKPVQVVAEFEKTLLDELDLAKEAANAAQFRRNFAQSPALYIPEVHWPLVRERVLVIERIYGIPINNKQALVAAGHDFKRLAERGVEIFFTQVFRDCFFHADMHPGNIFVATAHPHQPQFIAVDFGIVGSLSRHDQRYLAENFLAFFKRDYRRVAELHIESGWIPVNTRVDEFEAAIRTVCEPIFERPLREISFAQTLLRLFQTARRFHMEIQPQLVLLQKTLMNIEGLGRDLYPDLDLWATVKPYLEHWLRQQVGLQALLHKTRLYAPYWAEKLPEIPNLVYNLLDHYQHQMLQQKFPSTQQQESHKPLRRQIPSFLLGLGSALLIIAGFNGLQSSGLDSLDMQQWFHTGLIGIGLFSVVWGLVRKQ